MRLALQSSEVDVPSSSSGVPGHLGDSPFPLFQWVCLRYNFLSHNQLVIFPCGHRTVPLFIAVFVPKGHFNTEIILYHLYYLDIFLTNLFRAIFRTPSIVIWLVFPI